MCCRGRSDMTDFNIELRLLNSVQKHPVIIIHYEANKTQVWTINVKQQMLIELWMDIELIFHPEHVFIIKILQNYLVEYRYICNNIPMFNHNCAHISECIFACKMYHNEAVL